MRALDVLRERVRRTDLLAVRQDRLDRPAVLAREVVQLAQALADFVQPLGVELDARVVVLQELRGLLERDLGRADVRERLLEGLVDAREVLELVADEDEAVVERVVALRDLAVELGGRLVEALGVLQDAALGLEAVRLADERAPSCRSPRSGRRRAPSGGAARPRGARCRPARRRGSPPRGRPRGRPARARRARRTCRAARRASRSAAATGARAGRAGRSCSRRPRGARPASPGCR